MKFIPVSDAVMSHVAVLVPKSRHDPSRIKGYYI